MFVSSAARLCLGLGLFPQTSATTPTGVGPFGGDEVEVEPQQPSNFNIQVQVEPQKRGKRQLAQWVGNPSSTACLREEDKPGTER